MRVGSEEGQDSYRSQPSCYCYVVVNRRCLVQLVGHFLAEPHAAVSGLAER